MALTQSQLKKLSKIADVVDNGNIAIAKFIFELEEKVDELLPSVKDIIAKVKGDKGDTPTKDQLLALIRPLIPTPEHGHTPTNKELLALIKPLIPKVENGVTPSKKDLLDLIIPLIPKSPDFLKMVKEAALMTEEAIKPLIPTLEQLEKRIPMLSEPIRDSLELLKKDERLDKKAIKGLDDYEEVSKLAREKKTYTALTGLKDIVAGTNIAIDKTNALYPIISSIGGGAVTSVSNSNSTLTISPTTGAVVASLNLANANTWTATQNFASGTIILNSNGSASFGSGSSSISQGGAAVFNASVTSPIIYGSSSASGTLTLHGTSNATRGKVIFGQLGTTAYDAVNDRFGIGTVTPTEKLDVNGNISIPTTSSTVGQIKQNGFSVFHTYGTTNLFLGKNSGNFTLNTTSNYGNLGIGQDTLKSLNGAGGDSNVAIGSGTLSSLTTGGANVGVGFGSLGALITGGGNMAIGYNTLTNATTISNSVAIGNGSQFRATTGDNRNVAIGGNSLYNNQTGYDNVAIGFGAVGGYTGTIASSSANVGIGNYALGINTIGTDNVAVGAYSMDANTTGASNMAFGSDSLGKNTTGNENVSIGQAALSENTIGGGNVAIGRLAMGNGMVSGQLNTAIGKYTMRNATDLSNTAIGGYALYGLTSGSNNTAIGTYAGSDGSGDAARSLTGNTIVGYNSAARLQTNSNYGTYLGYLVGYTVTTGTNLLLLGDNADVSTGTFSKSVAIGSHAIVGASNTMAIGGTTASGYDLRVGINMTTASAYLHLPAGLATAGYSPLKFTSGTNLTTAEAGVHEYNGNHYLTNSAVRFGVGGSLSTNTTTVGNVGIGEDDLMTYSVIANTLAVNGGSIRGRASGTIANSINAKRLRFKFGGTTVLDTGAAGFPVSQAIQWVLEFEIIRTGATTQKCSANLSTNNASLASYVGYSTAAETLSGAVTLKLTGDATADNDVVQETMTVKFVPAPQA